MGSSQPILYVGLSNAAAGDVLIAVSLCIILSGHRGGLPSRTDNVVRMLMLYGIETGILTSVCATSCLILVCTIYVGSSAIVICIIVRDNAGQLHIHRLVHSLVEGRPQLTFGHPQCATRPQGGHWIDIKYNLSGPISHNRKPTRGRQGSQRAQHLRRTFQLTARFHAMISPNTVSRCWCLSERPRRRPLANG